jgi:hypothetical protein
MPASLPTQHSRNDERAWIISPRFGFGQYADRVAASVLLLCFIAGCVGPQTVRCPLDDSDLTKKILAVAPVGTLRDETVRRLRAAGIDGAFGSENSAFGKDYYCCQAWRRPHGEVWRISLLLHFDKAGNLCETLELPDLHADNPKSAKARA